MKKSNNKKKKEIIYDVEDATEVIFKNISKNLQSKFDYDDIHLILELQNKYFDIIGINLKKGEDIICNYPVDLDEEEMRSFIIKNAVECDLFLNDNELIDIFEAELFYCDNIGAIGDAGEFLN